LAVLYLAKKYLDSRYRQKAYQNLIDNINIGHYRYRCRDGLILGANEGFLKILELNMKPDEVIGRPLSELLIYIDGEKNIRDELRKRRELKNYEYHFKTLKGKDKYVMHNSRCVKDPYTREEVIEAFIEDVTGGKLSYEKMKESQERYEKLFKNSGDMVIICNLDDFVIEEVNPVTEVITGFSSDELAGKPCEDIFHPSRRKELKEIKEDLLFQGSSRIDTVIVCKNGTYKEVIMTLSSVEIKGKRFAMAVVKDISAMVKDREEQARRSKELEDFWKASAAREERIKNLRLEVERQKQQIKLLKEKNGTRRTETEE
jgi:PAS domain S-box-containing protein